MGMAIPSSNDATFIAKNCKQLVHEAITYDSKWIWNQNLSTAIRTIGFSIGGAPTNPYATASRSKKVILITNFIAI